MSFSLGLEHITPISLRLKCYKYCCITICPVLIPTEKVVIEGEIHWINHSIKCSFSLLCPYFIKHKRCQTFTLGLGLESVRATFVLRLNHDSLGCESISPCTEWRKGGGVM